MHPALAEYNETYLWTDYGISDYIFKWHGEFIGSLEFDIPDDIDGWNMTLTFPKSIYEFEICPAEVVEIVDRKVIHLRNHPWNAKLKEGDQLEMWFNARTWRKIRGLQAQVKFSANVIGASNDTDTESSSTYLSSMGYDNGLNCRNAFNNITCRSSLEIIVDESGKKTVQLHIPVNYNYVDSTTVSLYTDVAVNWITVPTFDHRFVPADGSEETLITKPQVTTDNTDKQLHILQLSDAMEFGRGDLIVQISFGPKTTSDGYVYPYIDGTPNCLCTRLIIPTSSTTLPP